MFEDDYVYEDSEGGAMKILITGMMKVQAQNPRPGFFGSGIVALNEALKKAGHSVDWRKIEYGENLDQYKLLILGLGAIGDFSNQFLYQIISASRYDNALYLIDDWRANKALAGIRDNELFRDFLLKNGTGKHVDRDVIVRDQKKLERLRENMFRRKTNLLGSFFEFGDRKIILEGTPFTSTMSYDPSSFLYKYRLLKAEVEIPKKRIERWIYGSLGDHSRWHKKLGAEWPIVAHLRKNGNFLTEPELLQRYAESAGMLAPCYQASGSGWWIPRYIHAARVLTPMHGDKSEASGFGKGYYRDVTVIEGMSPKSRREFAAEQHDIVMKAIPPWNDVVEKINSIVKKAVK